MFVHVDKVSFDLRILDVFVRNFNLKYYYISNYLFFFFSKLHKIITVPLICFINTYSN